MLGLGEGISGYYNVLLVLHILSAIIGLGSVMLNGLYASQAARRPGPAGRAVSEANFAVSSVGEYFIYAIPVFGILLVLASHDAFKFSQAWVWMSLVLYVLASGPPPQATQIEALGRRQAAAGTALDLFVVIFLVLMIWKPGL